MELESLLTFLSGCALTIGVSFFLGVVCAGLVVAETSPLAGGMGRSLSVGVVGRFDEEELLSHCSSSSSSHMLSRDSVENDGSEEPL